MHRFNGQGAQNNSVLRPKGTALQRPWRCSLGLPAVVVLAMLAGCGGNRPTVHGEVTFDGQPVAEGTISFEPADGVGPATGGPIADGKYRLSGEAAPVPGMKRVRISAGRKTGRKIPAGEPFPPDVMIEETERYIPEVYNTRSTLSREVTADGPNQLDFHLERTF